MNKKNETFAERLQFIMKKLNISANDLEKISGVKRQSITYIINNNLDKSKLANQLANALNVSYDWLTYGIDDGSFINVTEIILFDDIYILLSFLNTKNKPLNMAKSISSNKILENDSFCFKDSLSNTYFYCSTNKNITSEQFFCIDPLQNSFNIKPSIKEKDVFCFPIIEKKIILVE